MKFDRNTVIGFLLLALLFFGLFYFNSQESARLAKNSEIDRKNKAAQATQDSIAKANQPKPKTDTLNRQPVQVPARSRHHDIGKYAHRSTDF